MIESAHREFPPYISYLIATVMSVALLAMQATLPFTIKQLGGGFDSVGFLFMWTSFWYVMSGLFLGWISHHVGPRRVMLATLTICGLMVLGITRITALWQLYVVATVYFMSVCLFWAAAEHASTGLHAQLSLVQSTAIFCVAFSAGNGIGTVLSSSLQGQTLMLPFYVSLGLTVVVFALTWVAVSPQAGFHRSNQQAIDAFPVENRVRLRRSLIASRIGLVGVYGAYGLVVLFLPRFLWEQRGFSKPVAGGLASLTLAAMATTFALHGWRRGWPHKLLPVRLCPFLAAVGLLVVGSGTRPLMIGCGALAVGVLAGTSYMHNLYYSLEEPGKRARNAGIHEALVGTAFMIPPAFSGLAARWTNNPQSIFWVGAALAVVLGVAQNLALVIRDARRA